MSKKLWVLAILAMLLSAGSADARLRARRSRGCCVPNCAVPSYSVPSCTAPCAPCYEGPCKTGGFPKTCLVWYLGEYDGLHYHYAEYYYSDNCNDYEPTWWLAGSMIDCPQNCSEEGSCISDSKLLARGGCPTPGTGRGTPFPMDGTHVKPAAPEHAPLAEVTSEFKVDFNPDPNVEDFKVFKCYHYLVDTDKDPNPARVKVKPVAFALRNEKGDPSTVRDVATLVQPKSPLQCKNLYLVRISGQTIPVADSPGARP